MSNIIADSKINEGRPSIKCIHKGHVSIKQIMALFQAVEEGLLSFDELKVELDITDDDIATARANS